MPKIRSVANTSLRFVNLLFYDMYFKLIYLVVPFVVCLAVFTITVLINILT